jgi:D-alanyl-D-alanine-carboxypeptidase/D-alanyl-D-alanine-endopeptidase
VYQFLSGYELSRDPGSEFEYSNLGAGLLGHLLAYRAGTDYESLIKVRITEPLNMRDTGITLSSSMKQRMATGHNGMLAPVANWDLPTLAGAGALRSSANDMLTFLHARPPIILIRASIATAVRRDGAQAAAERLRSADHRT